MILCAALWFYLELVFDKSLDLRLTSVLFRAMVVVSVRVDRLSFSFSSHCRSNEDEVSGMRRHCMIALQGVIIRGKTGLVTGFCLDLCQ